MLANEIREAEIQQLFVKAFADERILVQLVDLSEKDWNEILKNSDYVPVAYTRAALNYQMCYMKCFVQRLIDLSVVIYHEDKAIGVWPVSLKILDDQISFVTNEGPIRKPLFIDSTSSKLSKKIYEVCLNCLNTLYTLLDEHIVSMSIGGELHTDKGQAKKVSHLSNADCHIWCYWEGTHSFLRNEVDEWYRKCMERNATDTVRHDLYVDLSKSYDEIKKNIRKSFKSLVNLGERLWNVKIYDEIDDMTFAEYRELHYQVAGRVTRSLETWELQKQAINNQDAFLVALYDENHILVGGGLFEISKDEAVYGVGVYKRELFDKPLGHVVQMQAIRHMQELGLKWYKIGYRPYKGDSVMPTDKECDIGYFKEGFATHMFLNILTKCTFN